MFRTGGRLQELEKKSVRGCRMLYLAKLPFSVPSSELKIPLKCLLRVLDMWTEDIHQCCVLMPVRRFYFFGGFVILALLRPPSWRIRRA